jgi:hypothetical protein
LVKVTVAPETAAPDESVTLPVTREVVPCAYTNPLRASRKRKVLNANKDGFLPMFLLQD